MLQSFILSIHRQFMVDLNKQIFDMQQQPESENIYACMLAGDQIAEKIKPKSIFMVGQSRVGKSTLFNYIQGIPLKVVKDADNRKYIYVSSHEESAFVKDGFKSVTLLPNVSSEVRYNGQNINVSMQDMAGYKDAGRNYVGVFGVSYMLKTTLNAANETKFILVVQDTKMQISQISDVVVTFYNFIHMLKPQYLIDNPNIAEALFNSVSLVITKAIEVDQFYLDTLKLILDHLDKLEDNSHLNKLTHQLISSIYKYKRLELFDKANPKIQEIPNSTILEKLSQPEKKWDYFNFKLQEQRPDLIIQLPFKTDFENIKSEKEKQEYNKAEKSKVEGMGAILTVLKDFLVEATKKWYQKGSLDYSKQFAQIKEILQKYNYYGDLKRIENHFDMKCRMVSDTDISTTNELQLLKKIEEILKKADEINDLTGTHQEKERGLKQIQPKIQQLLTIFKDTFCQTKKEEEQFIILSFILCRSIYECSVMIEIDGKKGSDAFFKIKNHIEDLSQKTISAHKIQFFERLNITADNVDEFSEMLTDFVHKELKNINNLVQHQKIYKIQIKTMIFKGQKACKQRQYKQSINYYIEAMKTLDLLRNMRGDETKSEQEEDYLEFRLIQILQKIGLSLLDYKSYPWAIKFFRQSRSVTLICKCYEKMINDEINPVDRYEYMQQYAKACIDYGRNHKAIEIYQQILDDFIFLPAQRKNAMVELEKCLAATSRVHGEYLNILSEKKRVIYDSQQFTSFVDDFEGDMVLPADEDREGPLDPEQILMDQQSKSQIPPSAIQE